MSKSSIAKLRLKQALGRFRKAVVVPKPGNPLQSRPGRDVKRTARAGGVEVHSFGGA